MFSIFEDAGLPSLSVKKDKKPLTCFKKWLIKIRIKTSRGKPCSMKKRRSGKIVRSCFWDLQFRQINLAKTTPAVAF